MSVDCYDNKTNYLQSLGFQLHPTSDVWFTALYLRNCLRSDITISSEEITNNNLDQLKYLILTRLSNSMDKLYHKLKEDMFFMSDGTSQTKTKVTSSNVIEPSSCKCALETIMAAGCKCGGK